MRPLVRQRAITSRLSPTLRPTHRQLTSNTTTALRQAATPLPPPLTTLSVTGSKDDMFPVRRVYCVGRNYRWRLLARFSTKMLSSFDTILTLLFHTRAHAIELNNDPDEPPFFFHKPTDAVVDTSSGAQTVKTFESFHFKILLLIHVCS